MGFSISPNVKHYFWFRFPRDSDPEGNGVRHEERQPNEREPGKSSAYNVNYFHFSSEKSGCGVSPTLLRPEQLQDRVHRSRLRARNEMK